MKMHIRSVTCFASIEEPSGAGDLVREAGLLVADARRALEAAGFPVQTARLATQPLSSLPNEPLPMAQTLWPLCVEAGFDYLSLGPVVADGPGADLARLDQIPELVRGTEAVFAGVLVGRGGGGLHLEAIRRTARIVREIAHSTEQGFGNLRLALLANVGPHAPFFPAAYHDGGGPAVAIATEAAGLAVEALGGAGTLDEARERLVAAVEAAAGSIAGAVAPLAEAYGVRFPGIDFSWAPFPEEARSIGAAVERLGVARFGGAGTLWAASFLTDCLRRASFPQCGFNGLMLPVLEDAVLSARSREGLFTVHELLLYSAVCGTGLDTVPLPGDVGEEELAGILLDVAALAQRLDKPLTARLMPVPGLAAGDETGFDFEYFANGQVLGVKGCGSEGVFGRGGWVE
jgi:uncharacterized protein (UPF0210 family)